MAQLPTSAEWWSGRTRPALPFGMSSRCFAFCPPPIEDQLHWWPNCLCTYVSTAPWPIAAPIAAPTSVGGSYHVAERPAT